MSGTLKKTTCHAESDVTAAASKENVKRHFSANSCVSLFLSVFFFFEKNGSQLQGGAPRCVSTNDISSCCTVCGSCATRDLGMGLTHKFHMLSKMCVCVLQAASIGNPAKFWAHKDEEGLRWLGGNSRWQPRQGDTCTQSAVKVLNRYRARVRNL